MPPEKPLHSGGVTRMQGGLDLDAGHVAGVLLETCKPWRGGEERSDKGDRP